MRFCCLITILLLAISLGAQDTGYEPGRACLKVDPQYKAMLHPSGISTGIPGLDEHLARLGVTSVKPRFAANAKHPGSADISLILEISFSPQKEPLGICNSLSRDRHVLWAEPILYHSVLDTPNDPFYPRMDYLDVMQADAAWSIHKGQNGSQPIILAVVDTGMNWKHTELGPNIWNNPGEDANANGYTIYFTGSTWAFDPGDLNGIDDDANGYTDDLIGWDFYHNLAGDQDNDPFDSGGHGTTVSCIADARTDNSTGIASVAWNVSLMPLACSPDGSSIGRGMDAVLYAAVNGARVINCSWGGTTYSQADQDVVDYVWGLGAIIVAASGNSNNLIPIYPSSYRNVVAVGLCSNAGTHSVATYGPQLDVLAPMDSVFAISGASYAKVSYATSYATPIASSLTALICSLHPAWTNQQVLAQLYGTCDDVYGVNPSAKLNLLGYGRMNAYRALSEVSPLPTAGLKLGIRRFGIPTETDGDMAIEPSEQFSFNFTLRNYALQSAAASLNITLTCSDPAVSILNNSYSASIGPDAELNVSNAFLVQVSPSITSKYISFYLNCAADVPILAGASIRYDVLVNAGGVYIWEGIPNAAYMSGTYIRTTLAAAGYTCVLGNNYNINGTYFPHSFNGFDAVFLSFGSVPTYITRLNQPQMFDAIRSWLETGGRLYIEGGDAIAWDIANYFPDYEPGLDGDDILWPLLGLAGADDGVDNPISSLSGAQGWHTLGLGFTGYAQAQVRSMDTFTPGAIGVIAFSEPGYGCVAVQSLGAHSQRVVLASFALKDLVDGAYPSTRAGLLSRIMDFFEDDPLRLPDIQNLSISPAGANVQLDWDYPFAADEYEIRSDSSPDGTFSTVEDTVQQPPAIIPAASRRFFRVLARKAFSL